MHQTETLLPDHWQLFLSNFAAISVQARLPSHPRCGAAVKVGFHAPPLSKFHLYSSCQYQPLQLCKIDNFVDFFCIAHNSHYRHCRRGSSALFSGWCTFLKRKQNFGPFQPTLLQIYAVFGVLFTGLNSVVGLPKLTNIRYVHNCTCIAITVTILTILAKPCQIFSSFSSPFFFSVSWTKMNQLFLI